MNIQDLTKLYGVLPQAGAFRKVLEDTSVKNVFLTGLTGSVTPMLFGTLKSQPCLLFILNDADEAGYFYNDLSQLLANDDGTANVLFYPSSYRRAVKYGQRDAANEILRTEVLAILSSRHTDGTPQPLNPSARPAGTLSERSGERTSQPLNPSTSQLLIVTYPEALAELVVSQSTIDERIIRLNRGGTADIVEIEQTLREFGFQETEYVYEPGQFAVRGSILDVYSYSCELPYRIDFFGDEIESIRTFEVQDQLSREKKENVEIVPELAQIESEKVPFFQFLPEDSLLVAKDFSYISDTIARIFNDGFSSQAMTERMEGATEMEQQLIMHEMQRDAQLIMPVQFDDHMARFRHVFLGRQGTGSAINNKADASSATIHFNTVGQPLFHKNIDLLKRAISDYHLQGYRLYVLADSPKQQERLRELIDQEFIAVNHTLHEGFIDHDLKACFFTDHQIFDRFHKFNLKSDKARTGKMALTMKELQEMEIGDYLVHIDYGIGKFGGLVRIPIPSSPQQTAAGPQQYQEVIRIIYQHNDKLDVSIHSLYKISKYRRSDTGEPPRLSILGSGAWERMKERTKKRIKDIARDLIRLYARRQKEKGFAYSPDSFMQHELEASFLYEDTPDQLRATQEVKADMEASKPMDRLVCGDVGFGKTEVAIRAAFKAACDSKQVAVMVPTTVLAFQHYQTFRDRLRDLPVRVDYLSRARSAKQTREVLTDLKEGKIDILVGTHKLIGKQVEWKDLGLLIIDEEQKFGVATKEKLRQLKSNVDTLTMSATPIPRTLQFSLMGARDMSIIRTPPPNRHPIYTELGTYGSELIADAINFEMSRNGQVFFVNNRISNLEEIRRLILKHVPDCRIAIGHGQMKPEELENILLGFINYDYDVLLSTTIVENGIDIPNANTIIINDAHRFGLSDLHQMRGRVGRSNRKAFCYLLAPPKAVLTPEARRRLEALETFSELGSGFNLAMQDLDIRGAGNLLGAEQSGFMEDLGYETYLKIIKQAMAELRNEAPNSQSSTLRSAQSDASLAKNSQPLRSAQSDASHAKNSQPLNPSARPAGTLSERSGERTSPLGPTGRFRSDAEKEPLNSQPLNLSTSQPLNLSTSQPSTLPSGAVVDGPFVADCAIESDLAMYFPETYVPGSSERMILYRELDAIEDNRTLDAYRQRLQDRFGPVPQEGEELMQVVALRRIGKRLGCERINLRQGRMIIQFVSTTDSPYYQSDTFGRIINYATQHLTRCELREVKGRRLMHVKNVPSAGEAVSVLREIEKE